MDRRLKIAILTCLTLAGVALRLKGFLDRSVILDEATVASYWLDPSFSVWSTREPSISLFVFLTGRLGTALLGWNEWGLRLIPMLLGAAVIPLSYSAGRRLNGVWCGLLAAFFFSFSFIIAGYSQLWRPYIYHISATLFMILIVVWISGRPAELRLRHYAGVALAVVALVLLSYTSLFLLFGLGLVLLRRVVLAPADQRRIRLAGLGIVALGGAAALGYVVLQVQTSPLVMQASASQYQPLLVSSLGFKACLRVGLDQVMELLGRSLSFAGQEHVNNLFVGMAAFVAAIGIGTLWAGQRGLDFLLLGLGGLIGALAAFAVGKWPLMWRLFLFMSPFYLLCLAVGGAQLAGWLVQRRSFLAFGLLILILSLLPLRAVLKSPAIYIEQGGRQLMAVLEKKVQDGDIIFVPAPSLAQFAFEAAGKLDYRWPGNLHMRRSLSVDGVPFSGKKVSLLTGPQAFEGRLADLQASLPPRARVWVFCTHIAFPDTCPGLDLPLGGRWTLPSPSQASLRLYLAP